MNDVTRILEAIERGDPNAPGELLPLVYDDLRRRAAGHLARERPDQTLQATALVHEAYLRLVGGGQRWDSRGHFFAAAAQAMRRILIEAARRKGREKHGGGLERVDLDHAQPAAPEDRHDLVALDAALTRLAAEDPQAARLVDLRYFAGLSLPEAAQMLGVSPRTADRVWAFARAWLYRDLTAQGHGPES